MSFGKLRNLKVKYVYEKIFEISYCCFYIIGYLDFLCFFCVICVYCWINLIFWLVNWIKWIKISGCVGFWFWIIWNWFWKGVFDWLLSEMKNVYMWYVKLLILCSFEIFLMVYSIYVVVILESVSECELCLW